VGLAAALVVGQSRRMIKIGDTLPGATLTESLEFGAACPLSPKPVEVAQASAGKRVVIFGLPGAYTPTCSAKHVPGYVEKLAALKAHGVDEVWCVSVNDGYVMAAWGREQGAIGKVRMLGDGNADFVRKLGLEVDLSKSGMGVRAQRFSLLVDRGVVKQVNVEQAGKFEVSDADTMLEQLS
jgi:glutaredoxin/glutathione-dependent peroxiredoxin